MIPIPSATPVDAHLSWLGWWRLLSAIAAFFWLSIEDTSTLPVALIGTNLTLALGINGAYRRWYSRRNNWQWTRHVLLGASLGARSPVTIAALMFFKTAWHSHEYPDFPLMMLLDMLARIPVWATAGTLLAAASWLLYRARRLAP